MQLGLHLNDFAWPSAPDRVGSLLGEIAQAGEAAGFAAIAVMDHVWQHPYSGQGPEGPVLEAYATLTFIAAHTSRVRLLALATPVSYRYPGMLVKTVTTVDVLSGGRAWLGLGVGDYEEETAQVCLGMWSGEHGADRPFHGRHLHLERMLNAPQSLTRPYPPIMIAGSGERKTLPLVARYADACNLRPGPEIPQHLDLLRRLCDTEGRDYDAIEKTCPFRFDVGERGSRTGELIEQLRWLGSMGIQTVFGRVMGEYRIDPIEVMGREVIPAVADV